MSSLPSDLPDIPQEPEDDLTPRQTNLSELESVSGSQVDDIDPLPDAGSNSIPASLSTTGVTGPASRPAGSDAWTVLQFILTLLTILGLWGMALLLGFFGIVSQASLGGISSGNQATLMQAVGLFASGVMLMPSVFTSYRRLKGDPLPLKYQPLINLNPFVPVLLLLPVLGLGYLASRTEIAWLVIPFLHVLAVVLPVLFLINIILRGLPSGSPQRRSGVFGVGLILGPFLILLAESAVLVGVVILVSIYLATQPGLLLELQESLGQLAVNQGNPEELIRLLTPYLANPFVVFGTLTFVAVFVPLIEELFKPIGVWFLAGRQITPAAGFAAGALSGAGYAIFESLALNGGGEDWLIVAVVRIGTAVVHIGTTAFSGWALALAWKKGRYLVLVLTYLGVVLVHGLWNGMTLMAFLNEAVATQGVNLDWSALPVLGVMGPVVLVLLTVGGFAVLVGMNRALRRKAIPQTNLE